ncbi:hypothetical protein [Streptomyces sp. NPDC001657]|uniref:hypothetical protein n=1 Tax=unclassified Streptomyces TaxID=2593676 RepID=UPI003326B3F8
MNGRVRNLLPSSRGWRARAAAVGSMALAATLCLAITPAQADGGGGGWVTSPPPGYTPDPGPDWSTPEAIAKFLSDCGQDCTFTPTAWVGEPSEGTPTMLGKPRENCTTENVDFNYGESETTGETTIIGLSLGANPVSLLPKIEHNWFTQNTESTVTTGTLKPGEIGWFDEVTVSRKAKGNWQLAGVDQSNPFAPVNGHNKYGPHEFTDVESDISYKVIRVQSRAMTDDERATKCGNSSPS